MPTFTGIFPGPFKKDKDLQQILRKWKQLMKELVEEWADDGDAPWWYNERTSVGLFAAAVWKKGGHAIEEYTTNKKFRNNRGKTNNKYGRGDLLFYLNSNKTFVAEAKQEYLSLNRSPDTKKVISLLTIARKDSVCVPNYGIARRLGMVFMVPYSKSKPTDERIRQWISKIEEIAEKQEIAAVWTFPNVAREKIYWKEKDGTRHYYPGVMLLLKQPRA